MTGQQQYKKALPMTYCTVAELLSTVHQFKLDPQDEKSPKLTLIPSGAGAHRVFLKGVLQEVRQTENGLIGVLRDRTAKILLKASESFQPEAYLKMRSFKDLPVFVAVVGRINLFTPPPEEGKNPVTFVSLNLDDIGETTKSDRYTWDRDVLRLTRERCAWSEPHSVYQAMALGVYGTDCETNTMRKIESLYQEAGVAV